MLIDKITGTLMRILWTAPLCLTLAACGGTSVPVVITSPSEPTNQDPPSNPPTGGAQTGTQMRAGANSLLADYADPVSFTTVASIPSTFAATYQGYAYGNLANSDDAITNILMGQLTLSVDLEENAPLSGTIENFTDDNDNALTGQLDLSSGSFNSGGDPSDDATLIGTFSGDLTDNAGTQLDVGIELRGDFLGNGQAAVGGNVQGRVTAQGFNQDINGGFIAVR